MADHRINIVGPGKQLPSGILGNDTNDDDDDDDEEEDDNSVGGSHDSNDAPTKTTTIKVKQNIQQQVQVGSHRNDDNNSSDSDNNDEDDDDVKLRGDENISCNSIKSVINHDKNDEGVVIDNRSTIIATNTISSSSSSPIESTNQVRHDFNNEMVDANALHNHWRYPEIPFSIRSAAIEQIRYRYYLLQNNHKNTITTTTTNQQQQNRKQSSDDGTQDTNYKHNNKGKKKDVPEMIVTSKFGNIDSILLKLRRDKSTVIRTSFDVAATAVLFAIRNNNFQKQQQQQKQDGTHKSMTTTKTEENTTSFWNNLPQCLQQYKKFEQLRYESIERSHNNKEYNKRKGGKIDISTITAATNMSMIQQQQQEVVAVTSTSSTSNSNNNKQSIKMEVDNVLSSESKLKPNIKNEIVDDELVPTLAKSSQTSVDVTSSGKKKKKKHVDDGTSSDNDDDNNHEVKKNNEESQLTAVSTTTTTIVPKFTRNTPASSAAALDFRYNSSRAILCVAGNIVFNALTPNYSTSSNNFPIKAYDNDTKTIENNVVGTIDILDVPQNPANKVIKSIKKKRRKRSRSDTDDHSMSDNDTSVNDDEDDDSSSTTAEDEVVDNNDTQEVRKKSSTINVNMGAVKAEAQLLAQRTICVVENAITRSTLRYQDRRDNAKYQYHSNTNAAGMPHKGSNFNDDDDDDGTDYFLNVTNPFEWKPPSPDEKKDVKSQKRTMVKVSDDDDTSTEDGNDYRKKSSKHKASIDSDCMSLDDNDTDIWNTDSAVPYQPNIDSTTYVWQSVCLPRFLSVLSTGAGHAIYHDIQWASRHGRIADLLRTLSTAAYDDNEQNANCDQRLNNVALHTSSKNFGPHLIVTTEPELVKFGREFHDIRTHMRLVMSSESKSLNGMIYHGSNKRRTKLRKEHFAKANGLPEAPFHVLITTYATFFQDYIHFCQLPLETVIVDDGLSFMATACDQNNSGMGTIWDSAIFSSNDYHVGLAGTPYKEWDYSKGNEINETSMRDAFIGLTARHRIMTASTFTVKQRLSTDVVAISGLVDFIAPQFAHVVREEWARSRIYADSASMEHFRKLVSRSLIVHNATSSTTDLFTLAELALSGQIPTPDRSDDPPVPNVISDDDFVSSSKIAFSRRAALLWLGPPNQSWLRYELGIVNFQPIIDAMRLSTHHGHFCEEITTASSTTTAGANGQVTGTMAFRFGVRCGRHFGSEPGLRQHVSALHAPPGTWLCRTCGADCIMSQARTHHERSCGQPCVGTGDVGGSVGATPTVGQGASTGKKKPPGRSGTSVPGASGAEEKDPDGSFRVPGYRGVWVNKNGKHFAKINGIRLTEDRTDGGKVLLFDASDDAARMHDSVAKEDSKDDTIEYNFKADGSRIIYEDINLASTSGLGGSAANVVPALSVINIKDLPPDVKPLLRDPRQTSRTGGNSKRHVYAYRGVCRQARKGHDRWQSQISFMGVNHYLGTFDSEWDAAAIYAWAHLILYGEEATKQAQKEGEEAAAAYEQEKRDIAAGKIPISSQKQDKTKKAAPKKEKDDRNESASKEKPNGRKRKHDEKKSVVEKKGKRPLDDGPISVEKRKKPGPKPSKMEKEQLAPLLENAVVKAPLLGPREAYAEMGEKDLMSVAAQRIQAARGAAHTSAKSFLRPCTPLFSQGPPRLGGAMLVGLPPSLFGWDLQDFVGSNDLTSEQDMEALQLLAVEYDDDGVNEKFKTILQGTLCIIGSASQKTYESLGLGRVPVGGVCGKIDCHIGGVPGCCSETAACIRYFPTSISQFQFMCISDSDVVILNGRRLTMKTGWLPLMNDDICVVGGRVFAFIVPSNL